MSVDFNTDIGKVRLRIGDVSDLPFLPDEVIQNEVVAAGRNLPKAAQTCAQYILAQLAFKSHKKMVQLEIWGSESFENFRNYLMDCISNPAFMAYSPVAYGATVQDTQPILQFQTDWNQNWTGFTQSQLMHMTAIPNDGQIGIGFGTGDTT